MAKTILPSGEEVLTSASEILRYMDPDGLRQLLRQERLRWALKTNKDVDYYDNTKLFKYSGEVHNEGYYQRMEIRTFPDNGAYGGYAGVNVDSGVSGIVHNLDKWDHSLSEESKENTINRLMLGAMAVVKDKLGYGVDDNGEVSESTANRSAMMVFDPYDARVYAMTADAPTYMNNDTRQDPIPLRAVARMADIPTKVTQLVNDINYVTDPDYTHTDNNFNNSNRYVVDNLDDRTFVYPSIAKDENGEYISNIRYGLNGDPIYSECDDPNMVNGQPDLGSYRGNDAVSSYNKNGQYSGFNNPNGYLQGVFRSVEELEKVDLVGQKMTPNNTEAPGARRTANYYIFDGQWSSNWFDRVSHPDSYLATAITPFNMEIHLPDTEPWPYPSLDGIFDRSLLYQWRYNRVDVKYPSDGIVISIYEAGSGYVEGDVLSWRFGEHAFTFTVTSVGANGQITKGKYNVEQDVVYDDDPSTHGVAIEFANNSSAGTGAKFVISSKSTIITHAAQLKNNLYAYVDIAPTVPSDNSSPWSDNKTTDVQGGKIISRSTAAGPAYSGINSGRGGEVPSNDQAESILYEHGGNATAGAQVHLFRYVINTQVPTWKVVDGVQVFTGKWVDQGPLSVERPADIKALLFSNYDTNNFNNYYKFMLDLLFDNMNRNPDAIVSNNENAVSIPYLHVDQVDPTEDRKFTTTRIDPKTGELVSVDITDKVWYINAATGMAFVHNTSYKSDTEFGYGYRSPGWVAIAGAISK